MKVSSFEAASPYATSIAGRPVLVVESDPDQRRRVTTQLAGWGYTPIAAGTAEEALELLARAGRVAFSVVAIRLPGMSGIDLLRRAGDLAASGPVIMVADNGHSAQIVEAIQAGADDFLRRPYTAEDLEQVIRGVASRPRRDSTPAALPYVKAGQVRGLAVLARKRNPQMPDVPTMTESGVPGLEIDSWIGLFAPARTPPAVSARLQQARSMRPSTIKAPRTSATRA